jgi:FAD/FMN-containing dehydrogenase
MNGWSNWAGNVRAPGAAILRPHDLDELRTALLGAAATHRTVRPAGAGHSFTDLVHTEQYVLDLGAFSGVIDTDTTTGSAWVGAGTPIYALGEPLWRAGLSLANQGDIDVQTIGGATATGTHGTGPALGCLSSAVSGIRLVLADGSVVECGPTEHPELFAAGRLSLGAVGVVVALRLQLLDAYHLHERTWLVDTDACLAQLDELVAATRHFEFFWLPGRDRCFAKALQPHPGPPDLLPDAPFERIDRAYRVFPSVRSERFVEMEFAVPAAAGPACFAELRALLRDHHPDVTWPLEYRTLAADDTLIGPASDRASVTISVHQAVELDHRPLFADAEAIFRNHRGRPHWGKLHHFDSDELAATYPGWSRFWQIAREVDPGGLFRNARLSAWC